MGNQQVTDLVWLAAMLNAEGYVSVAKYKRTDGFVLSPRVSIANTDPAIIVKVRDILRSLRIGYYIYEQAQNTKERKRPLFTVRTDKHSHVKTLLTAIMPYLIGEKRARAELVLEYVTRRIDRGATTGRNIEYDLRDVEIGTLFETWFLNDYTREARESLRYSLASERKSESAAETTAPQGNLG